MANSTTATPAATKLREGVLRHRAGRLEEAAVLYAEALALDPTLADAHHLAGLLAHQQGRHEAALAPLTQAIERAPTIPDFQFSRGVVRRTLGDFDGAKADFEKVTTLNPRHVEAWVNLGMLALRRKAPREALAAFERAAELAPDAAEVQGYLGTAHLQLGALDAAVDALKRAVALAPDFSEAHYNLGIALDRSGRAGEAEAAWRRAIETNPYYLKPWASLGVLMEKQGRTAEARAFYQRALTHASSDAKDAAPIWNNLGNVLDDAGEVAASVDAFERATALAPDDARTRVNLGTAYLGVGLVERAGEQFAAARRLAPTLSAAAHCELLNLLYRADGEASLAAARAWAASLPARSREPHTNGREPERRLRIGYVSPDFSLHVVAWFTEPVLAAHDHAAVEVFCYAEVKKPDAVTERFRRYADHWRDTTAMDDAALARQIRVDGIDILVDLAGHTLDSRIEAFAFKPAPIQMTWIGYPATTGLSEVEWRISDGLADPPGMTDAHYTEKLLRLSGFNCYQPPADAPDVAPAPCSANGYVTFGSFNHPAKIGPEVLAAWAELLVRAPTARLIIKHRGLLHPQVRAATRAAFQARNAAERVELVDYVTSFRDHLAMYGRIDVALDSFPYNGTTTTCEALWMGVPVVALAGDTHHARVGVSILSRVGLSDLIAESRDTYVELAARLADEPARVSDLRQGLRQRMAASPLCDARAFTRELEGAFRALWREWCARA